LEVFDERGLDTRRVARDPANPRDLFGIGARVLLAATEGPSAWVVLGIGLLILLALVIRCVMKRYPPMWDEAPADETAPARPDDNSLFDGADPNAEVDQRLSRPGAWMPAARRDRVPVHTM